MPVEAKPLFRPEVVRPCVTAFRVAHRVEQHYSTLGQWAIMMGSAEAAGFKEQQLLSGFSGDIFGGLLRYSSPVESPKRYTLSREKHVQVDGKFADAVLGEYGPGLQHAVVVVEGEGPRDPLDRPFAGRKMSAVDQGYRYAINLVCDWIIVTSMHETRL